MFSLNRSSGVIDDVDRSKPYFFVKTIESNLCFFPVQLDADWQTLGDEEGYDRIRYAICEKIGYLYKNLCFGPLVGSEIYPKLVEEGSGFRIQAFGPENVDSFSLDSGEEESKSTCSIM